MMQCRGGGIQGTEKKNAESKFLIRGRGRESRLCIRGKTKKKEGKYQRKKGKKKKKKKRHQEDYPLSKMDISYNSEKRKKK